MQPTCARAPPPPGQGIGGWIVTFGGAQLLLSQVPDFHSLW